MKTLLLKFAGPLQSWGTGSRFENRSTNRYPSKSAVVGMLAASFGYSRNDERITQFNQLDFATRIDQPGELLSDYHIAQKYKPSGEPDRVYVTNRQYIQDAVFVVALGSNDQGWLMEIEHALKHPYYQPFLGRRSNPLTPDFFLGMKDKDPITCLEELEWQASDWYKRRCGDKIVLSIYADAYLLEQSTKQMMKDKVISFSQRERQHGYRAVGRQDIVLSLTADTDEHDAFSAF